MKTLDLKSQMYLRRAYACATRSIKKLYLLLTLTGPSTSQTGSQGNSTDTARGAATGRGGKSHSHQSRQKHSPATQSRTYTSDPCTPPAVAWPAHRASTDPQISLEWQAPILLALNVAILLGPSTVEDFCNLIIQCVHSPFIVNEVTVKVIEYFKSSARSSFDQSSVPLHNPDNTQHSFPSTDQTGQCQPTPTPSSYVHDSAQHSLSGPFYSTEHLTDCPSVNRSPSEAWPVASASPIRNPRSPLGSSDFHSPYLTQPQQAWSPIPLAQPLPPGDLSYIVARNQQLRIHRAQQVLLAQRSSLQQQQQQQQQRSDSGQNQAQVGLTWPQLQQSTTGLSPPTAGQLSSSKPETSFPVQHRSSEQELIERLINRTHSLFHKFIDQRLQLIGPGQTDWDDFVDLILKAYQVHLTMPAIDSGLHWNNLLTRIRRHQKCSSALWQRILAGIQTADLKRTSF